MLHLNFLPITRTEFLPFCVAIMLSGCALAPGSGPKHSSFTTGSISHYETRKEDKLNFVLVDVDQRVAVSLKENHSGKTSLGLPMGRANMTQKLRSGDLISLEIFESDKGGLFINDGTNLPGGNKVIFPDQRVNDAGFVKVPFAGEVKAAGREPYELASAIEEKLAKRAIEPQAVIAVKETAGRKISVGGHVRVPNQFQIPVGGIRLLEALALAKGSVEEHHELIVTVQRDGKSCQARLADIVKDPKQNIYLKPDDNIVVEIHKRFYSVLGSVNAQSRRPFLSANMSVRDAIAQAYGLDDYRANAKTAVLYRPTKRKILEEIGVDLSSYPADSSIIPVVYKFDLQDPSGFFLAGETPLNADDFIYVAASPIHDIYKLNRVLQIPGQLQNNNMNAITNTDAALNTLN